MKIFKKTQTTKRVHIYFCGMKVASYRKRRDTVNVPCPENNIPAKSDDLPASLVSCDIYNYREIIANGTRFQHLVGVVISRAARIGNNCIIYQNVTIGSKDYATGDGKTHSAYPEIGNNVTIYAGAVIVGPVKVGDNAVIGANSVVISDIPANSVAVGVPARVIKQK